MSKSESNIVYIETDKDGNNITAAQYEAAKADAEMSRWDSYEGDPSETQIYHSNDWSSGYDTRTGTSWGDDNR